MEDLAVTTITITLVSKADVKYYTQRMRLEKITNSIRVAAHELVENQEAIACSMSVDGPFRVSR